METFQRMVHRSTRILAFSAMFLLLPMMFLTTLDVSLRRLFSFTIPGTMELSTMMLGAFILLGLSYTQQCRGHVRITFLVEKLPTRVQAGVEIILSLFTLLILFALVREGWIVAVEEEQVSDMLRIPLWPFRMLVVPAFLSFALEIIVDLINDSKILLRRT